jgi:hypothetical protein
MDSLMIGIKTQHNEGDRHLVKALETRLNCQDVTLNSFILSWTRYPELQWGPSQEDLEKQHVFFMTDDRERYIGKLMAAVLADEGWTF